MSRKLKVLGMAFVAVLAMSAISVASASAQQFHSEGATTTLTGSQLGTDVFTTDGGTVSCSNATYVGTQNAATTTTVSVAPTYSGCTALSGFASAVISPNGCEYLFHVTQNGSNTGTVDIVCPAGKEITIVASAFGSTKCTAHVPPQTGLGPIHFTNQGAGTTREVKVSVNITTGIKYTETAGSGFGACASTSGTSNGSYKGEALVTGEHGSPATHTGIWIA